MSENIIDYLGRQTASFDDVPVNDVDSLIFCTISYFYFEEGALGQVHASERLPLPMVLCGIPHEQLFGGGWLTEFDGEGFLAAVLASPRFAAVQMGYYVNQISDHIEKQFSAVTFFLPDAAGTVYVAYRGTDNTLAGWKEDFNLGFMDVVPSQRDAAHYLSGIASACGGPLIVGGHSKGGNLSEFAALTVDDSVYKRLRAVYNHDGPSFMDDPSPRIKKADFKAKLHKTVPESSVFGMMMERRGDYRIIRANSLAFLQHAPLNWVVEGDDFVTVQTLTTDATLFDETMNSWALGYTSEQREKFVDTVFEVLKSTKVETWSQFEANQLANMGKVLAQTVQLEPDMRDMVIGMFMGVAKIYGGEAFKHLSEKAPVVLPTMLRPSKIELPKRPDLPFFKNQTTNDTKDKA